MREPHRADLDYSSARGPSLKFGAAVNALTRAPHAESVEIACVPAEALGRAGFVGLVPNLPGLGEGEITPRTVESTVRVGINAPSKRAGKAGREDTAPTPRG
jgi:hypothetical protein